LLFQSLSNLIENAARYSVEGGRIELAAEGTGARVRLHVLDEGPPIPAAEAPHVFEKFYRGAAAPASGAGTGLGLAIVRAMVELCGGRVGLTASGRGNDFQIDLPAAAAPRP